jgi:3-phosphoshikimate 1-carboxyvinyltransferase
MASIHLQPPRRASATANMPGDKSISHRALMLAAVARGLSTVAKLNEGTDVAATLDALALLGVPIEKRDGSLAVTGVDAFDDPAGPIDCRNSGTTMRLLTGLLAGRADAHLDGDVSLRRRPMERVAAPLRAMGADVTTSAGGTPPLEIRRVAGALRGVTAVPAPASAQVKSALLFAGLFADDDTVVIELVPTRDHTERLLSAMGADIASDGPRIRVRRSTLRAFDRLEVPGDFSAAFFFLAAALVRPGASVVIRDLGVNPSRIAAIDVVRAMGGDIRIRDERIAYGEPVATVEGRGGDRLRGVEIPATLVPNLIDEIPALCALGAAADGDLIVKGAADLRNKESDRIATTVALIEAFDGHAEATGDGIVVRGGRALRPPAAVSTGGDHRIGMSAAILAAASGSGLRIDDADCVATSFPGFEAAWNTAFA